MRYGRTVMQHVWHPDREPLPQGATSVVRDLLDAQLTGHILKRGSQHLDLQQAYALQREGRRIRVAVGGHVVGHKIGLSSPVARAPLAAEEPVSGYLMGSTVVEGAETYSLKGLNNPRVEAEIAFVMGARLSGEHLTVDDVIAATSELAVSLEIVASRWSGGPGVVGLLVADNVSAVGVVLGDRAAPRPDLDDVTVSLRVGDTVTQGSGRNVLDHPAKSVAWLVSHLARQGARLEAGDLVMSGSLNTPIPVAAGDVVVADFGELGQITTTFTV